MKTKADTDISIYTTLAGGRKESRAVQCNLLAGRRLAFLEKIDELGSITRAAEAVGISYLTGLKVVNMLNGLANVKLFIKQAGGPDSGTRLSREGRIFLHRFREIWAQHERLLGNLLEEIAPQKKDHRRGRP